LQVRNAARGAQCADAPRLHAMLSMIHVTKWQQTLLPLDGVAWMHQYVRPTVLRANTLVAHVQHTNSLIDSVAT
jgi:hypothetical protein